MEIGNRYAHSSGLFLDPDDAEVTPPKSPLMAGMSTAFSLVRKVSKKVSKPKQGRTTRRTNLKIIYKAQTLQLHL